MMQPWPSEIQREFPLQHRQVATRPWWQYGDKHFNPNATDPTSGLYRQVVATRSDGLTISFMGRMLAVRGLPNLRISEVSLVGGPPWKEERERLMVALDNHHPLPHPGVRVGQIWGYPLSPHPQITETMHIGLLTNPDDVRNFNFLVSQTPLSQGPFLVSDQACPWLAPWSPVVPG